MESFIRQTLLELQKGSIPLSDHVFILPSKRAGSFLLKELGSITSENIFAPDVFSIEEFTEKVSRLETIDNTITIFEFYEVYKNHTPKDEIEEFDTFINWAQSLIHDFNEIDRYLIDHDSIFNYLSGIQDLKHWYLQSEKTDLIQNYLKFWKRLPGYYEALKAKLEKQDVGYQGMIYRKASEEIGNYISQSSKKHVFIGFNALNASEQEIIQQFLNSEQGAVHWDIDERFLNDSYHSASLFIREYLKNWSIYQEKKEIQPGNSYDQPKNVELIGVPKNIGQAKYIGDILKGLSTEELENTAIVLGEEEMLLPILNSIPDDIKDLNITMGFPIKNAPIFSLFESLFLLHSVKQDQIYYKDVIKILKHPSLNPVIEPEASVFVKNIIEKNLIYLEPASIKEQFSTHFHGIIEACFDQKNDSVSKFLEQIDLLIAKIKDHLKEKEEKLSLEFLFHYHILFNKLKNLNKQYPHIKNIKSLHNFYKDQLSTESLDFQGMPYKGLQLMGMLESRVLDFENIIITSLNEGVLPAGKSDNSFIPYDLKKEYKMPTYREKDAVYTYHFYRLMQRAKNVFLLYNTEADGLNSGEKSRFLTQLEIENNPNHQIRKLIISPEVPMLLKNEKEVQKTPEMMSKIQNLAEYGFSPSALSVYIRNPIDFYKRYVLGIRDQDEIEETVAFNTLGTVVHNTLEKLYKPLEGQMLNLNHLENFKINFEGILKKEFQECYGSNTIDSGKNLLIAEVAKRYIINFLKIEKQRLDLGEQIKIRLIEADLKRQLDIPELDHPVFIKGKIDRFEDANSKPRIIDYKTGKVEKKNLAVINWEDLTSDYENYSKAFQVLTYAYLLDGNKGLNFPAQAGIISFKNMATGFQAFCEGPVRSRNTDIHPETLNKYSLELKKLILEICNPNIPFTEKEV